jgi:hypothetical protein
MSAEGAVKAVANGLIVTLVPLPVAEIGLLFGKGQGIIHTKNGRTHPFLGGLIVGEYFALPDEERERIWNEEHTMEIEDLEEYDVKPNAYVPVLEGLQEEKDAHRARMEGWLAEARALRREILKRREGIPLPDSVEMLQELREERDEQILGDPLQSSSGLRRSLPCPGRDDEL